MAFTGGRKAGRKTFPVSEVKVALGVLKTTFWNGIACAIIRLYPSFSDIALDAMKQFYVLWFMQT